MGVWGTAIFSDDTACDIRDEYSALLISGISDEEAEEALLKGYESLNGTWDEPVVWLALAFCEWKKGRLRRVISAWACLTYHLRLWRYLN